MVTKEAAPVKAASDKKEEKKDKDIPEETPDG